MENLIRLAATLPNDSKLRDYLNGTRINILWNQLQHPPLSFLGHADGSHRDGELHHQSQEFKYRSADGSNNVS